MNMPIWFPFMYRGNSCLCQKYKNELLSRPFHPPCFTHCVPLTEVRQEIARDGYLLKINPPVDLPVLPGVECQCPGYSIAICLPLTIFL